VDFHELIILGRSGSELVSQQTTSKTQQRHLTGNLNKKYKAAGYLPRPVKILSRTEKAENNRL
jgi:hypothetical protein